MVNNMNGLDRFGVYLFPWGKQPPTVDSIVGLAQHAEQLGYDSVHVPWHFTLPATEWIFPEFDNRFNLDPLVVVPAIVERTQRIRVAFNAAIFPTLHPFLWAQYLASLDVHSGGRTIAGAAVGWWLDDFKLGLAELKGRGARMDEALDVVTRLWSGEAIGGDTTFWNAEGAALEPRPLQQPLPLWIGGGERSIQRAARWAEALFPLDMQPDEARVLRTKLDDAAAQQGREMKLAMMNYVAISDDEDYVRTQFRPKVLRCMNFTAEGQDPEKSIFFGPAERCAELVERFFDAGIDYIVLDCQFHGWEDEAFGREQMSRFAEEVVPLLR